MNVDLTTEQAVQLQQDLIFALIGALDFYGALPRDEMVAQLEESAERRGGLHADYFRLIAGQLRNSP